jgi:GH15 family glucan-1,4-alpha-glucosidase
LRWISILVPKIKNSDESAPNVVGNIFTLDYAEVSHATDPRWISTMRTIEKNLIEDSLVYRYNSGSAPWKDGNRQEGTFSTCSFWYVECLAREGDLKQARLIFEKALGYANHLGLYAEQLGPCGEHLGNFPQALSHIALISAAWNLDKRLSETE